MVIRERSHMIQALVFIAEVEVDLRHCSVF